MFAVVAAFHSGTAAFEVVDGHANASLKATGTRSAFCAFILSRLIGMRRWRAYLRQPGHGESQRRTLVETNGTVFMMMASMLWLTIIKQRSDVNN